MALTRIQQEIEDEMIFALAFDQNHIKLKEYLYMTEQERIAELQEYVAPMITREENNIAKNRDDISQIEITRLRSV